MPARRDSQEELASVMTIYRAYVREVRVELFSRTRLRRALHPHALRHTTRLLLGH